VSASDQGRHYGLDWLRIGAFGILILYHSALGFAPAPWLIHVDHPLPAVDAILAAIQPWRMALLFVVSGYATHSLMSRSAGPVGFLRARAGRLLPPLVLGTLLLAAPETWIGLTQNHGYRAGFLSFLAGDWFRFHAVSGVKLPNPEHLWFLSYLFTYTLLLASAAALAHTGPVRAAVALADRWIAAPRRFWLPLAPLILVRLALLFTVPEQRGLLHDWVSDVLFVPAFLFGFALGARPVLWATIHRMRPVAAAGAAAAAALLLPLEALYPDHVPHLAQAANRVAQTVMAWTMIVLLLGAADRWLRFDRPWRRRLNEAVFPLYLVHQTIIVILLWSLKEAGLPYPLLYLLLVGGTAAGAWLFYEAGRRAGALRPLFGLAPPRPRPAAASPPEVSPAVVGT